MKSFVTTEHREDRISQEVIRFDHDGRTVTANPPTPAQFVMFEIAYQATEGDAREIADVVNFFFCLFGKDDQTYFKERLFDQDDPFDLGGDGGMIDILSTLVPVWIASAVPSEAEPLSH